MREVSGQAARGWGDSVSGKGSAVIEQKEIDGVIYFVGTVGEFPDVEVYGDSPEAAHAALVEIIEALTV